MTLKYQLNNTDITNHVEAGVKSSGGEHSIKSITGHGDSASLVYDEGMKPIAINFVVFYNNDASSASAFVKDAKSTTPTALYLGDSDWFYVPDIVAIKNLIDDRTWKKRYQVSAHIGRPERYAGDVDSWALSSQALPQTKAVGFENDGNLDAELYSLVITAITAITDPELQFLDGSSNIMDSLVLGDTLFAGEVMTVDRFGQISQEYSPTDIDLYPLHDDEDSASGTGWILAGEVLSPVVDATGLTRANGVFVVDVKLTGDDPLGTYAIVGSGGAYDANTWEDSDVALINDGTYHTYQWDMTAWGEGHGAVNVAALNFVQLGGNWDTGTGAIYWENARIVIGGDQVYELAGTQPITQGGLMVSFTPTLTGTGAASLQLSTDNESSWETVITNSDDAWTDGLPMEVYVPDAKGFTTVHIKWEAEEAIDNLDVDDITFSQVRYVSDNEVPKITIGSTWKPKIAGSGTATIAASWYDREYP